MATISLTGSTANATFASLTNNIFCTAATGGSCSKSALPQSVQSVASLSVAASNLDTYVNAFGGAPVLARTAKVSDLANRNSFASAQSTDTVTWDGAATVTYDYLAHAGPSFAAGSFQGSAAIDFGNWLVGSTNVTPVGYSVYNRLNTALPENQVGLDLDIIQAAGDTARLSTTATTFTNLAAGAAQNFTAAFDVSSVGTFSGNYVMKFSDQDVGAASSRYDYTNRASEYSLSLQLDGDVFDHASGSFDANSTVTSTSLDLGRVFVNSSNPVADISIYNATGLRVALGLTGISGSGDTGALFTTLVPISINRGTSTDAQAVLSTAQAGNFTASYNLALADDLGTTVQGNSGQTYGMSVQLSGQVVDHAAASFDALVMRDTLDLDFGIHSTNSSASPLLFDIFNLFGANRTSLDLLGVTGSGDTGKLSTCLLQFLGLVAGDVFHCAAFLDTSVAGAFGATYVLELRDNATGIGGAPQLFYLTLNLSAEVRDQQLPMPEPNSLVLLGATLLGVYVVARKGKRKD